MARLNTKFNYETQVEGLTIWAKIETLKGFLAGRNRALALEEVNRLKLEALKDEIAIKTSEGAPIYEVKRLRADLVEQESVQDQLRQDFELCRKEKADIEQLLATLYGMAERHIHKDGTPFTDDEMFEANAELEFCTKISKEIQAEIIAQGRPSAMRVSQLMSCPKGQRILRKIQNLIPENMPLISGGITNYTHLLTHIGGGDESL